MATLTSTKIKNTYDALLKASDNDAIGSSAKQITDGLGNGTPLYISTTQIGIGVTPEATYDLHVYSNAKVGGNLTVTGDLTVDGTVTTVSSETLTVTDPLIELAKDNTSTDALDIGFYGKYAPSGTVLYAGLFRDTGDSKFKLFRNLEEQPTTTVNTGGTGYTKADLVIGGLEATTGDFTDTVTVDGDIEVENSSGFGRIEIGGSSGGYIDLKSPFSDDFDLRLYTAGTNAQINALNGELDITAYTNINLQYQGTDVLVMSSTGVAVTGTGSFTGQVTIPETPVADTDAASKGYVDSLVEGQDTLAEILANGNTTGGTDLIVSTSDQIFLPNGSLSNPALSFTNDTDTGISYDASSGIRFSLGASERFRISNGFINLMPDGFTRFEVNSSNVIAYVDTEIQGELTVSGTGQSSFGGQVTIPATPSASTDAASKGYVDSQVGANNELSEVLANGNTTGGTDIAVSAGDDITFTDTSEALFGTGNDLKIYHNGSTSDIWNYTGDLRIRNNSNDSNIDISASDEAGTGSQVYIRANGSTGAAELFHYSYKKLETTSTGVSVTGDVSIPVSNKLFFGGGNHTYISEDVDDNLTFFVGGAEFMSFAEGVSDTIRFYKDAIFYGDVIVPEYIKHEGDADTSIRFTNNHIRFYTANNEVLELQSDGQVNVISSGTATNPCIAIGDDFNTGIWRPALDTFAISTGGSERMRITSSGNVSIDRTTNSVGGAPSGTDGRLNVYTDEGSSAWAQQMRHDSTTGNGLFIRAGASSSYYTAYFAGFDESNVHFVVRGDGSVGIGGVTSPNGKLEVFRPAGQSSNPQLILSTGESGSSDYSLSTDVTAPGDFCIVKGNSNVAANVRLKIDSSGKITSTGASEGVVKVVGSSASHRGEFLVEGAGQFTGSFVGVPSSASTYNGIPASTVGITTTSTPLVFATSNSERMRITSGGDVQLVGNKYLYANPSAGSTTIGAGFQLDAVNNIMKLWTNNTERMRITSGGEIQVGNAVGSSDSDTGTRINATQMRQSSSGTGAHDFHDFYRGTEGSLVRVGNIRTTGTATAYNTSSDYRLKENVVEMTGALDRVSQLKPSRFNFIADADKTVDGFLAHEVQDIVPEAITGTKDEMRTEEYEETPAVYEEIVHEAQEAIEWEDKPTINNTKVEIQEWLDDNSIEWQSADTKQELLDRIPEYQQEAQEEWTEQVLVSEAVMATREVPVYQGIDQSKLVPLLVGAIQELKAEIETLKQQINN